MRLILCLTTTAALAACTAPGFLPAKDTPPPPPLLPVEQILTPDSPQLDAEAADALRARGDTLRDRAGNAR